MKIAILGKPYTYITDDSRELDAQGALLLTKLSLPYQEEAKKQGCSHFIDITSFKEMLPLSIPIVGVTGTNGKTTTAAAIYSILLDLGYNVGLLGTRGFFINGERIKKKGLTTPLFLETYHNILLAQESGCDFFVMEVSSHAIHQDRIGGIPFALKILTNITSDHLDYHKSLEEYIAVKNSFFNDDSFKLINSDEPKAQYSMSHLRTYGIENAATYKVSAYSLKDGIMAQVQYGQDSYAFFSSLFGRHNLYNLLAATSAVEMLTQKNLEEIFKQVEYFGGVKGRMQQVHDEPLVIIDFAHTEDGMRQIFESFLDKKIVVLFGAGGDRDKSKRPKMGAIAEKYAHRIYITSDNPRYEDPHMIINDILQGIHHQEKCLIEPDRPLAIQKALSDLQKDEVLLILGKGDESEQIIKDKVIPMSDALLVEEFFSNTALY